MTTQEAELLALLKAWWEAVEWRDKTLTWWKEEMSSKNRDRGINAERSFKDQTEYLRAACNDVWGKGEKKP